jgi:SpoVK/Ycf46/Vps4 family AAA+-type ATPase
LDQWLGGSEAAIRSLFARARSASPCILFFDEIDAIASNREEDGASVDVTSRVLTTFLNEMDGISSGGNTVGGVLVVACTNRVEALDAALLRPGRLDEHVLLDLPVMSDVEEILQLHLLKVPLHENVSTSELSELLVELNASGADIEGVSRDACLRAIRDESRSSFDLMVTQNDLLAAIRDWRK